VRRSYLARVPYANRIFRALAPLYPRAFEAFDLSGYDAIVSSTTAWAKGVRIPRDAVHVCYVNTVSRFAFASDEYVGKMAPINIARPLIHRLIAWDKAAALRPTQLVANSRNVAARIRRHYGRDSEVLHCPVDIERFSVGAGDGGYFIVASRLLPYKRIELAIDAASLANVPLLIAGTGRVATLPRLRPGATMAWLGNRSTTCP
jgi:glycosyltransferase involved in cell wall biosynthesis